MDKKPHPSALRRGLSTIGTSRARNIIACVLVPPFLGVALGFLPPVPIIDTDWGIIWKIPVALMAGFIFVLREFKEWALLLCWAYFIVMFWVIRFVDLFMSMKLYGTYY